MVFILRSEFHILHSIFDTPLLDFYFFVYWDISLPQKLSLSYCSHLRFVHLDAYLSPQHEFSFQLKPVRSCFIQPQ